MAYHKVLFIGRNLEEALAPYYENNKEVARAIKHTEHYLFEYENHKDNEGFRAEYPNGSFSDFLLYWVGIPTLSGDAKAEADKNKEHHSYIDENGEQQVVLYLNPNTQFQSYEIIHDFKGFYDYRKELAGEKKMRRQDFQTALKVLGHTPNFEPWESVLEKAQNGNLGQFDNDTDMLEIAQDYYYNQPDRKALADILPYVEDCIGSAADEKDYVSHASLPYYAILTDEGWFSQVQGSYYMGITAEPLSDKEWTKLQTEVVKRATSIPNYKAYILSTRI